MYKFNHNKLLTSLIFGIQHYPAGYDGVHPYIIRETINNNISKPLIKPNQRGSEITVKDTCSTVRNLTPDKSHSCKGHMFYS